MEHKNSDRKSVVRLLVACVTFSALAACHHRHPKLSDAQLEQIHAHAPGMTENCLDKIRWNGVEAAPSEVDKCFKMQPARRWRGLWRDQFEGQRFCPAPAQECPDRSSREAIWLEMNPRPPTIEKDPLGALYQVDFIGRRTADGGPMMSYGFQQQMIVDRLISIKQVEAAPKP